MNDVNNFDLISHRWLSNQRLYLKNINFFFFFKDLLNPYDMEKFWNFLNSNILSNAMSQ